MNISPFIPPTAATLFESLKFKASVEHIKFDYSPSYAEFMQVYSFLQSKISTPSMLYPIKRQSSFCA